MFVAELTQRIPNILFPNHLSISVCHESIFFCKFISARLIVISCWIAFHAFTPFPISHRVIYNEGLGIFREYLALHDSKSLKLLTKISLIWSQILRNILRLAEIYQDLLKHLENFRYAPRLFESHCDSHSWNFWKAKPFWDTLRSLSGINL